MEFNIKRMDFIFFEDGGGSGGESSGVGASGVDTSGWSPEARSLLFGEDSSVEPSSGIEYGREMGNAEGSQVGSDTDASAEDIDAEFAELIADNGRYHDIFNQRVTSIIQDRFRNNQKNLQAQVDSISEKLSPLFLNYGLKPGDFEGLESAIANDENFYKAGAERSGLSVEQYRNHLRLQAEAEQGRRITEAYQQEQKRQEMYSKWEQDADSLRQSFPNFDLRQEIMVNEDFRNLLDSGVDVRSAFVSTHLDAILTGQAQEVSQQSMNTVLNNIRQRAQRPVENGLRHQPAHERRFDPSTFTDEDMDNIIERVRSGETFSF